MWIPRTKDQRFCAVMFPLTLAWTKSLSKVDLAVIWYTITLRWYFCIGVYMTTSLNGNVFRVTGHLCGEFTGHRWISFTKASDARLDVFFDLRVNKRLSKHSWGWWFETPSSSLWRHCNELWWSSWWNGLPIIYHENRKGNDAQHNAKIHHNAVKKKNISTPACNMSVCFQIFAEYCNNEIPHFQFWEPHYGYNAMLRVYFSTMEFPVPARKHGHIETGPLEWNTSAIRTRFLRNFVRP